MYEVLTGELPASATERCATETLLPPRQLVPHITSITEQVILNGMKVRVEDRFQTADEFIDALKGKFVSPSLRRSRQLVEQGKLAQAVQAYDKCLANEPHKGWKQASLSLWADALLSFEQAKNQAQAPAWVFLNLGITHEHLQNTQKAIQVYEACSRTLPNDTLTLFRLGTLFGQQGQWSQARSCLERAVQLKPEYAEAHHNLGWVLLNIKGQDGHVKNFREMWSAYRKAVELYEQQQKSDLAQAIKQAFQVVEVEL